MTAEHFEQLFEAHCERSPFHPFTVELTGGHRFEVDHPRAMVMRDGVAVYLRPGGVPEWFDHESVAQIVSDIADASAEEVAQALLADVLCLPKKRARSC